MIDVVMPQMGESIVEGTLTKWLKKPGEHVERDEPLFEISTDKVDTEIPSPAAGTLAEILVEEGKTVGINAIVGRISDGVAARPPRRQHRRQLRAPAPAAAAPAPAPHPRARLRVPALVNAAPAPPTAEETAGPLSPLVRKMARENNIDLSKIRGTGAGARITKQDLEAYYLHRRRLRPHNPPLLPPRLSPPRRLHRRQPQLRRRLLQRRPRHPPRRPLPPCKRRSRFLSRPSLPGNPRASRLPCPAPPPPIASNP